MWNLMLITMYIVSHITKECNDDAGESSSPIKASKPEAAMAENPTYYSQSSPALPGLTAGAIS